MKTPKIDKHWHIQVGKQIKIVLARCERVHTWNSHNLIPGTIHTIVDRPSRKSKRNGDRGVWVNGTEGKVYCLFYEWLPYIPKVKMVRMKEPQVMIRTKKSVMIRTK